MTLRHSISLLTVLALIVAILYPIPLHSCQMDEGDVVSVTEGPLQADSCCNQFLVHCICTAHDVPGESSGPGMEPHCGTGAALLSGDCRCVTIPNVAMDTAVPAHSGITFAPPLAFSPAGLTLGDLDLVAAVPGYKIGGSPPYMAALAHYTYLRTSVLLI